MTLEDKIKAKAILAKTSMSFLIRIIALTMSVWLYEQSTYVSHKNII